MNARLLSEGINVSEPLAAYRELSEAAPHLMRRSTPFYWMEYRGALRDVMDPDDVVDHHPMTWSNRSFGAFLGEMVAMVNAHGFGSKLAKVIVYAIPPAAHMPRHHDTGKYNEAVDRFHVPLVTDAAGSVHNFDDEEVRMRTGELWWFNHRTYHSAGNRGTEPRLHLIFDVYKETH